MNMFSPMFCNECFDLDDEKVYKEIYPEWLTLSISELWREAWRDAGESLIYMQYWHPNVSYGKQVGRIDALCKELMKLERCIGSKENCIKIMSWRFRFKDEVNNMC